MSSLADILLAAHHRDELVADAARLVEDYIQQRGGLKGMGLKTGLALAKAARPDILHRASDRMLPDMVRALEPLYQEFRHSSGGDFAVFLDRRADAAVELLLGVADAKVAAAHNAAAKSVYQKFRGGAADEARGLLPRLGKLVSAYL